MNVLQVHPLWWDEAVVENPRLWCLAMGAQRGLTLSSVFFFLEQTPCSAFKVQSVCLVQMLALLEEMYYELGLVGFKSKQTQIRDNSQGGRIGNPSRDLEALFASRPRELQVGQDLVWLPDRLECGSGNLTRQDWPRREFQLTLQLQEQPLPQLSPLLLCHSNDVSSSTFMLKTECLARYVIIHGCCLQDVLSKRDICVLITAWWA